MAAYKALGVWLKDSGWTAMLNEAGVATDGTAESFLEGKYYTRTRRAHQVTAACLYILMMEAFKNYRRCHHPPLALLDFDRWVEARSAACPMFAYWLSVMRFELSVFSFERAHRTRDFSLYLAAIDELLPWFFALDHSHYSRWLSVHRCDMADLARTAPSVLQQFKAGNFVMKKTSHCFSDMPIDHANEQNK